MDDITTWRGEVDAMICSGAEHAFGGAAALAAHVAAPSASGWLLLER